MEIFEGNEIPVQKISIKLRLRQNVWQCTCGHGTRFLMRVGEEKEHVDIERSPYIPGVIRYYRIYSRNSRHRVIDAQWMAEGGHSLTPTGKIRRPSIELMCSWIVRAWDMVDQGVIVTSFLKTGISNALDGSEDDALWQTEENVDEESESEEDYSSEEDSNDA